MSTNRYIDKLKARLAKEADQRMQLQALLDDQVARNRALLAERDAAQKDAERLDWLDGYVVSAESEDAGKIAFSSIRGALRECVDAAIDAALQGEQP